MSMFYSDSNHKMHVYTSPASNNRIASVNKLYGMSNRLL